MNSLFTGLFAKKGMAYLLLDENLNITETSGDASRFADFGESVMPGDDVRMGFPEFFGVEEDLTSILDGEHTDWLMQGIGRATDTAFPIYFDIYVTGYKPDAETDEKRLAVVLEDVTERLEMEQKLLQSANRANLLLDQLKEAHEQLKVAKEAAEAATHAKSAFLANMSHEIRTPISGVIGMTEIVLDTEITPNQREYLGMVKTSADSLLELINDILDLSKIEAEKLELEPVDFSLRDALGDAMHTLALRADGKGLELAGHVLSDVPDALVGDSGRLRQIIVNLVGNAIKFTEQGEVVVHVEIDSQTGNDVLLHFAVRDTGIGIPPERQAAIFQSFEQADSSTTRKYGGTGLGLSISQQLSELFGGKIWVESEVGVGSIFHFTARFDIQKTEAVEASDEISPDLRGLPILVVDDNATNRRVLQDMLTHWGMKPTVVDKASAALSVMEQAEESGNPFTLTLIDGAMPQVSGLTLVEWIRENPALRETKVIMLISASRGGEAARSQELGVAGQVIKPIKQSALLDVMMNALGAESERHPLSDADAPTDAHQAGRRLRILLAEDNTVNQRIAVILLERWGHTVVVANNGKEALAAVEKGSFNLVLMDIQMPEMDGLEATIAIREKENVTGGHLPIIAMTASIIKEDQERCLEVGMNDVVSKPIQRPVLMEAIERVVIEPAESQTEETTAKRAEPVPSIGTSQIIDTAEFLESIGGEMEIVRDLVGLFLDEDCPKLMTNLREAVARCDSKGVQSAAHALKGLTGEFCAKPAFEAALTLETIGRNGDLSRVEEAYAVLQKEIERLKGVLIALANESQL